MHKELPLACARARGAADPGTILIPWSTQANPLRSSIMAGMAMSVWPVPCHIDGRSAVAPGQPGWPGIAAV